ncbi:MAG: M48 family metallopeptidase [Bacteroidia bacterium]|nr:M48 family metallopeptidase [Bacteroidia bacterium]
MDDKVKTAARYFNGVSARPFESLCSLSEASQVLVLEPEGEAPLTFSFRQLHINHLEKEVLVLASDGPNRRIIEIRNAPFIAAYLRVNRRTRWQSWRHWFVQTGTGVHLLLALAILAFCAVLYFFAVPALAEKAVDFIPRSVDEKLGASFPGATAETEEGDSLLRLELNRFLRRMAPELDSRYRITVINEEQVNAFALPDGRIMVYSGILKKMHAPGELAGLLAHEVAHVEHRHSMRLLCRNLSGYLLLTLVLNDVNGLLTLFADNAQRLQQLRYSRNFEREADLSGLALLRKQQIGPEGMLSLFRILQKEEGLQVPGWMSTHPVSAERIQYLQEKIREKPYPVKQHPDLEDSFKRIRQILN